jgi:hypothetical protein
MALMAHTKNSWTLFSFQSTFLLVRSIQHLDSDDVIGILTTIPIHIYDRIVNTVHAMVKVKLSNHNHFR